MEIGVTTQRPVQFNGYEEDYRFNFEKLGSREISLNEINNKTEMVRRFILSNPTDKYTPKQISSNKR